MNNPNDVVTRGTTWIGLELILSPESKGFPEIRGASIDPKLAQPMFEIFVDDQSWYWSNMWQRMEDEADEALSLGNMEGFDNMEDFIRSL